MKPVHWMGSSLDDLRACPDDVQDIVGQALYVAQTGGRSDEAKPLKGFNGASVLEIVARDADGTYRAVYTVQFPAAVYVLHVFQKKSKRGIATPKSEMDLIRQRLKTATAEAKGSTP